MPVFLLWFLRGGVRRGGKGRGLQVSNCVYISPVEATADCSVIHAGRRAQNHTHTLTLSLHTPYVHYLLSHTSKHKGSHKKRVVKLISTPPLSCVCPIHCHIITLCMIILLNLPRIKHASHKEHIYMLMQLQYSAER